MAHYTRGAGQCITETFQTQRLCQELAQSRRQGTNQTLSHGTVGIQNLNLDMTHLFFVRQKRSPHLFF